MGADYGGVRGLTGRRVLPSSHYEMTVATSQKSILIIAGPNGAGKTTFATEFLPNEADCRTFVNADMIAAGLNPFEPERSAVAAGRLMLRLISDYVRKGESFAFETTLSGRSYARMIPIGRRKDTGCDCASCACPRRTWRWLAFGIECSKAGTTWKKR